jgi:hypothetical protein
MSGVEHTGQSVLRGRVVPRSGASSQSIAQYLADELVVDDELPQTIQADPEYAQCPLMRHCELSARSTCLFHANDMATITVNDPE